MLGVNSQFSLDDHIKLQDEYFYKSTYQNKKVKLSKVFQIINFWVLLSGRQNKTFNKFRKE